MTYGSTGDDRDAPPLNNSCHSLGGDRGSSYLSPSCFVFSSAVFHSPMLPHNFLSRHSCLRLLLL